MDAVRAGFSPRVFPCDSVEKLDVARDLPWLDLDSQQARDIERFLWFSNGYIARDPVVKNRVIDIRYTLVPNELAPLWSIELRPNASATEHTAYRTHRDPLGDEGAIIWEMMEGG